MKDFNGGEIHIPVMISKSVRDVVRGIICKMGKDPNNFTSKEIGLRKGEKLHEKLYGDWESPIKVYNDKYVIGEKHE